MAKKMKCPNCGTELLDGYFSCPKCRTRLEQSGTGSGHQSGLRSTVQRSQSAPQKRRWLPILIAVGLTFGVISFTKDVIMGLSDGMQESAKTKEGLKELANDAMTADPSNPADGKKYADKLSKFLHSANAPQVDKDKLIKQTELLKEIQAETASLDVSPGSLKARDDVRDNIRRIDKINRIMDQMIAANQKSEILKLKKRQFSLYKEQQAWLLKHWGKWRSDSSGNMRIVAPISQSELNAFNRTVTELPKVIDKSNKLTKKAAKEMSDRLSN